MGGESQYLCLCFVYYLKMQEIKVLLVDNDPSSLAIVEDNISERFSSWIIYTAANPKEALKLVKELTLNLIITDLSMPPKDTFTVTKEGVALAQEVREICPTLSIALMSGTLETLTNAERELFDHLHEKNTGWDWLRIESLATTRQKK